MSNVKPAKNLDLGLDIIGREELGLNLNDYVIISIGELNKNKNQKEIIKVLPELSENVKYILVGKGELKEYLQNLAKEYDVDDRVVITGFRTDVKELLYAADCFAFPSKREGLGIAALEGLSAGLPVIGHDIGGIKDFVINGVTGWLCVDDYKTPIFSSISYHWDKQCIENVAERFDAQISNDIMKKIWLFRGDSGRKTPTTPVIMRIKQFSISY